MKEIRIEYTPANTIGHRFHNEVKAYIHFKENGFWLTEKGMSQKFEFKLSEDIEGNVVDEFFDEKYFDTSFFPKHNLNGARIRYRSYKMIDPVENIEQRIGHYNLVICDNLGGQVQSIYLRTEKKAVEILEAYENWISN